MNKAEGRKGLSIAVPKSVEENLRVLGWVRGWNNRKMLETALEDFLTSGEPLALVGVVRSRNGARHWGAVPSAEIYKQLLSMQAVHRANLTTLARSVLVRYLENNREALNGVKLPAQVQQLPIKLPTIDDPIVPYAKIASADGEYYASCPHCHRALPRFVK